MSKVLVKRLDKEEERFCNACGNKQSEVKKLLLLPNYALCNICIDLAKDLIEEDDDEHISTLSWLIRLGITPKEIRKIVKTK